MSFNQQLELVEWIKWPLQLSIASLILFVSIRIRAVFAGVLIGTATAWIVINLVQYQFVIPLVDEVLASNEPTPTWLLTPRATVTKKGNMTTQPDAPQPFGNEHKFGLDSPAVAPEINHFELKVPTVDVPEDIRASMDKTDIDKYGGYDPGMAENVAILLFGWVPPFLWLLTVLLIRVLSRRLPLPFVQVKATLPD